MITFILGYDWLLVAHLYKLHCILAVNPATKDMKLLLVVVNCTLLLLGSPNAICGIISHVKEIKRRNVSIIGGNRRPLKKVHNQMNIVLVLICHILAHKENFLRIKHISLCANQLSKLNFSAIQINGMLSHPYIIILACVKPLRGSKFLLGFAPKNAL